jgi:1-deoxy-D-xylulose 5-phosphate reductoisomerase
MSCMNCKVKVDTIYCPCFCEKCKENIKEYYWLFAKRSDKVNVVKHLDEIIYSMRKDHKVSNIAIIKQVISAINGIEDSEDDVEI